MSPQIEALIEAKTASLWAVRHLFDAQKEISKALVAQAKAEALRKREER